MLGASRRDIECRSTSDPEGSHIRPGSRWIDRIGENDDLPLKLWVEENDSCVPWSCSPEPKRRMRRPVLASDGKSTTSVSRLIWIQVPVGRMESRGSCSAT